MLATACCRLSPECLLHRRFWSPEKANGKPAEDTETLDDPPGILPPLTFPPHPNAPQPQLPEPPAPPTPSPRDRYRFKHLSKASVALARRLMNDRSTWRLDPAEGNLHGPGLSHFRGTLSLRARHLRYLSNLDALALGDIADSFGRRVNSDAVGQHNMHGTAATFLFTVVVTHQQPSLSEAMWDALEALLHDLPRAVAQALSNNEPDRDLDIQTEPCFWVVNGASRVALPWKADGHWTLQGIRDEATHLHMV